MTRVTLRQKICFVLAVLLGACAAPPVAAPTNTTVSTAVPTPTPAQSSSPTPSPAVETSAITPTHAPEPTSAPTVAPSPTPSAATLKVIATFSVLADFVRVVAGDTVALTTLVGPDSDTHEFEPAPSDSVRLADANVIIENGLGLERWLDNLVVASGSKALRIVTSAGVTPRTPQESGQPEADPHIWQNPLNAIQMVKNIVAGLSQADATHADLYAKNGSAYIKQLQNLDAELGAEVDKLSKDARKIVTSHDALGYFAERYGFEIIGSIIQSLSTEAGEPSAQDIAQLVNNIQATGTKAIFLESMTNPTLVERVASEAGVNIGAALYTDALGAKGSAGATYLEAMRHNAQAIVGALR